MPNLRDNARNLRKHMTDAERHLWSSLRHTQLGARFRRQAPIGPYIADFACFDSRLVIEIDGGQHADQAGYDSRRDAWLKSQGFTVLRFWNNEVLGNRDGVLERILGELRELRGSPPHPNPPPQGGREMKDVASCDTCSELPNPPPQGGRAPEEGAAASSVPTPSPLMGEGWGGGEAPRTTAPVPHPKEGRL